MADAVKNDEFNLQDALEFIDQGQWNLPNFQRKFVWGESDIKLLLDSIFHNYPMGVLLMMPDGNNLAKHPFDGSCGKEKSEYLILDGQQRLTSCYQAFYNKGRIYSDGTTKYYFLDTHALYNKCIDAGMVGNKYDISRINLVEDKIIIVKRMKTPPDNIMGNLVPFCLLKDEVEFNSFFEKYLENANKPEDEKSFFRIYLKNLVEPFSKYSLKALKLSKGMDLTAVCRIFETLNNTGIKLDSFDICVARYLSENSSLDIKSKLDTAIKTYPELAGLFIKNVKDKEYRNREMVLQAIALHAEKDHKKNALAKSLNASIISEKWDLAISAFRTTATILDSHTGLKTTMDLIPYSVAIPVIAASIITTGYDDMSMLDRAATNKKILSYFYYTAFNERYVDGAPGKMGKDYKALKSWISDGKLPNPEDSFECAIHWNYDYIKKLKKSSKGAIPTAIRCVLFSKNPKDFYNATPVHLDIANLHHLFPLDRYNDVFGDVDSILNLSFIEKSTNGSISNHSIEKYTSDIGEKIGKDKFKSILEGHFITGKTYDYFMNENYEEFIKSRSDELFDYLKTEGYLIQKDGTEPLQEEIDEEMRTNVIKSIWLDGNIFSAIIIIPTAICVLHYLAN
ncbi:MAG: DUF262 domain-containing protein [Thermoplasmata archaeon]|nr:DUF262 domain-containing protein [Thermoplasmata archaeon]